MQVVIFTEVSWGGFGRYAGTYRVATELRQAGYTVQVIEFFVQWDDDQLTKIIDKFITNETLLVGFSCTFFLPKEKPHVKWVGRAGVRDLIMDEDGEEKEGSLERIQGGGKNRGSLRGAENDIRHGNPGNLSILFGRENVFDIFDYVKQRAPNSKIVVGGARSFVAEDEPYNYKVDYVLSGQSDVSILALADHVLYGSSLKVAYKKNACSVITEKDYPVENFTTSRILYQDNDLIFDKEILPIEIARGCIFKCSFCSYSLIGKRVWEFNRAPELVAADLIDAYNKFGSTGFMFCDDTYNDSVDKVEGLHKEFIKLPFELTFSTYGRADMLVSKPHTAALLYESGMRSVFFGIETLNHESGKAVGKGMDPERLKDGLYKAKEVPGWKDIVTSSGIITGLPFDTVETTQATFDWLLREDCPLDSYSVAPFTINPESAIGKNMEKFGYKWDENGEWYSKWMTEAIARELALEYRNKMITKPRRRFQFTYFGRMQNIGWTLEDFDNHRYSNRESEVRMDKLKSEYYEKLMEL
jgi:radical SAM superfamily enzyme YgiQ (UPF0313 family)|tara:strand:- start:996 stop:2579 length:1584 start_codon:yes stop_codon:yes gene_type:complete